MAEPDAQDVTCDWRWTPDAKAKNQTPVLVIECKAEGVDINIKDYYQGESYTRATGCQFFIANTGPELATFAEEINGVASPCPDREASRRTAIAIAVRTLQRS